MKDQPDGQTNQIRRENKRLKKQNRRQKKRITELEEANKRLRLEIAEYRQQRYKAKAPVTEDSVKHVQKKRGAQKDTPDGPGL